MAKRRRGRGVQSRSNHLKSKKTSPENNVLEDKVKELNSRSNNDHPVIGSEVEEVNPTSTFQDEKLDHTAISFDGFTGPPEKSKLKSLSHLLHNKQIITRKRSLELTTVGNTLPLPKKSIEFNASCKDNLVSIDQLGIKSEVPDQFEDDEINVVSSLGSAIKVEVGETSGINDPSNNTGFESSLSAFSLESSSEDITDYKSLFEAVCKHIKIPANISKNELFKTLDEKYLTTSNNVDSINVVDKDAKPYNYGIADNDLVKEKKVKTEPCSKSLVKKPEIKIEDASEVINYINNDNPNSYQVEPQFKSDEEKLKLSVKEKLISGKEMLIQNVEILNSLTNNFSLVPSSTTENVNCDFKLSNLSSKIETKEIANKSSNIENEVDVKSISRNEMETEKDAFRQDVVLPSLAIVEIKKEKPLASQEGDSNIQKELANPISTDHCALNRKIKREWPIDSNINESSSKVKDEICLKLIEENSFLTSEFEGKTCSIEDGYGLVEKIVVGTNSVEDTEPKLDNSLVDVVNKPVCGINNNSTQSVTIERMAPLAAQDNECIDSNLVKEVDNTFSCPMEIIMSQSLKAASAESKCTFEDANASEETTPSSLTLDDRNAPNSTKNKVGDEVNSLVDSKGTEYMPHFDNNHPLKNLQQNDKSENQISKKWTTFTLPDDNNKSNEIENLVAEDGNDGTKNTPEEDTECDVNYSDFFVIDEVNDKFYLEVCDLENESKKNETPDRGSKVPPKSANTSRSEKSDKKSEKANNSTPDSIPGLSFIIGMKSEGRKSVKAVYDCVLCSLDKNSSVMTAHEMKCHVKTRSHLMNLMMVLNCPLYEQYTRKDREWVSTSSLLEAVLKVESTFSEQLIVGATNKNYASKRKEVVARIKELKDSSGNASKGTLKSTQENYIKVPSKPLMDSQSSVVPPMSATITMAPISLPLQTNQLITLPENRLDVHSEEHPLSVPISTEPHRFTAPMKPVDIASDSMQTTFISKSSVVVSAAPYVISSNPVLFAQSENTKPVSEKCALTYENMSSEIIEKATVSAPFVPASSSVSISPSDSSLLSSTQRKDTDSSLKSVVGVSAKILMPPPLSISVPSKLKRASKEKMLAAPSSIFVPPIAPSPKTSADPSFIPIPPIVPPKAIVSIPPSVPLPPPVRLLILPPVISPQRSPALIPVKFYDDYDQVVIVSDSRYESFLKNLRSVPNVLILSKPDLKPEDLYEFITRDLKFSDGQKRKLYLIVTGIYSITNIGVASSCSVSNCKRPLEALNPLDDAKYCGQEAKFATLFAGKLISVVNSIIPKLSTNSHIAILPPLPIAIIPIGVSHKKLHEKKLMFPDYMVVNRKASISSLYTSWMENIFSLSLKSLHNLKELDKSLFKILDDIKKLKEMSCSEQDNPSYNFWMQIVKNVVNAALPRSCEGSNADTENWQTSIEKLSRPNVGNTANSRDFTKIAYDHLVFIGHSSSLELLPEIEFCHYTKWDFEEIVESQNLFIKMAPLNKMAIKKVLFILISDIAMIGIKERNPECLVKKCEKTLINIHTQVKKPAPKKMRQSILMPIDIIITEIKKFCIFESRVVVAPFTPKIYIFVPNMNAEIKFHSKMHDFKRLQKAVCFLKGSTKFNWEQTLKLFEAEWGKLALEIPQETMEHIKYIKQILTDITTKDYKSVTWKNLTVDSPVDTELSLTIWKQNVEELAWKSWVEPVAIPPFPFQNITASESLPLFPSATGLQSKSLQPKENISLPANYDEISVVKHITPHKIIMPDHISLSDSPDNNEVHKFEINRDHSEVIQFSKEILNAKRLKKIEAGNASTFKTVYIVRHVNQQVSQKELINPFSDCNFKSKMIFHNFSKYDKSDLDRLLAKLGDYPARSLCCLVFDLSVITTKLVVSSSCGSRSCNPVLFVNDLQMKSSLSSQSFQELDHLIEDQLNAITAFIQKLNKRISVLILPLVPTKIYCEDENVIDHQTSHAISNLGTYVVHGSHVLWKRAIQTIIQSWNNIMEKNNGEYDLFNYIYMYTAIKPNTFLLLNNVSDFIAKWTEPDIWKAFVEVLLLSLVPKKNSIVDMGINFMSNKALVSVNITETSSTIPYGFLEELFKSVDEKVIIEKVKDMYIVKNIVLHKAILLAKIMNEYRVGDRILSASIHGITDPVNTEINKMQYLYITSIFENVYKSWKPWIITNLIKEIEGFDVTTLKTTLCTKGPACPGTKCCVNYHSLLDKRRNPLQVPYKMLLCNHPKQTDGTCKDGDRCPFSRNIFEQNFHPSNYQVKLCLSKASSEICNKRGLCKYAHIDTPELLFTSDWQDVIAVGADNLLKFFAGAIRGSRKLSISNSFKIILVSPSAELLDMVITVCDELIKAFGLKAFILGKSFDKPDDYDIIAGEPQEFADLDTKMLTAKNGAIIVDDTRSILGNQEKADALYSLIRRVRQTPDGNFTNIGLVVTCATEKSYKLAGGAKYFSSALGTKLHEKNYSTDINNISTSLSMDEMVFQLHASDSNSSKRKDYSRSRSRSKEKKLCLESVTETSQLISSDSSGSTRRDSDKIQKRPRSKLDEKSRINEHKSSSHSTQPHSKSKDQRRRAHSRSRDHKRRSCSRDRKMRSRSRDRKMRSRSRDHKRRSRSRDRKVRSRSSDRKVRPRSRDRKVRSRSRDHKVVSPSVDHKAKSQSIDRKILPQSKDYEKKSPSRAPIKPLPVIDSAPSNQGISPQLESSPLMDVKLPTETFSSFTPLNWQSNNNICHQQKQEYWNQLPPRSSSLNNITIPLEPNLNKEVSIIRDQLGAKLYEEYVQMLDYQTQLNEKEFLVFKNVPELCPSYERYYGAFSSMYDREYGFQGEEHRLKKWTAYWMSKLDEIKMEDLGSRQEKLLEEFKNKVPSHFINTKRESNPGTSFGTIPFSATPEKQEKNLYIESIPSVGGEEDNSFDFDNALDTLEKLFDYIGFLGPALNAMVTKCKELGLTKEAYNVFTLSENVMVVNMVLDKVKTLKLSASGNLFKLYEKAIEIIPKLLTEAKIGPKPKVNKPSEDLPIDVIAIARVSMGKSSDFTLNLLKSALQYEGISNPSRELINDLYLKVCKMQFELSQIE